MYLFKAHHIRANIYIKMLRVGSNFLTNNLISRDWLEESVGKLVRLKIEIIK